MKISEFAKRIILRIIGIFFLINLVLIVISFFVKLDKVSAASSNEISSSLSLLSIDDSHNYQKIDINSLGLTLEENSDYSSNVYRFVEGSIDVSVDVIKSANYNIVIDYYSLQTDVQDILIDVLINDSALQDYENIILPTYWQDLNNEEIYDIYQNEVTQSQTVASVWQAYYLYDQRFYKENPLEFNLNSGINKITFKLKQGSFLLGSIYLVEVQDFDNYESNQNIIDNNECIVIEGEKPTLKTSPDIRSASTNLTHLTPYSTSKNKLNNLSGDTFNESGSSVTYEFDIKTSGYYRIALKYYISQTNTNVYSKIKIDNLILYDELNRYCFKNNLNNKKAQYAYETLNNGDDDIYIYLESGKHYITLTLDSSLTSPIYYELQSLIEEINELYLEIIKLTGGNSDKNRNWNIDLYIPTAKTRLEDWKLRLENLLTLIDEVSKSNSSKQNRLYQQIDNAYKKICSLAKNPNKLPQKLNVLYEGSASASLMLSNSLHTSTFNPLSIDKIYIYGSKYNLPKIKNNFFVKYFATVQKVCRTNVRENDLEEVTIWVNRSTYYVSMMQQFADAYYTPYTNVKIRFNLLPDESKIIYANASNTAPDAALGVGSGVPYSLGLRGALADLRVMDGFGETLANFSAGSIMSFIEGNHVYGLPETQDFVVQFYREDILNTLNIDVPKTYDDLIKILPTLQRYGMNYYMPLAGGAGLKALGTTAPFIYQYGGDIYSSDYLGSGIDSKEGIMAMTTMVDLFTLYSLPLTTQNFYNDFRNGLVPIGMSSFDTYLQLLNAAPEIEGKWHLALSLGVEKSDGTIDVTQTGDNKCCVIFEKSNKKEEAWNFIKWWLSDDIQIKFASDIQATYGSTFLWNTANINAFKTLAIPEEDKQIIIKQLESLYNIPQTPATYMYERGISNAWNACVFNNTSVRAAVTDYALEIKREATRKMKEFKYLDENGNVLKQYKLPSLEEVKKWQEE